MKVTSNSYNIVDDPIDVVEEVDESVVSDQKEKKQSPFITITIALFMDPNYIYNLTAEAARQNIFMVLRRLAIKYPLEANVFNDGKVNQMDVLRFWSDFLYNGVSVPRWVFLSGAVKSRKTKDGITQDQIKLYKKHYGITNKDFEDAMRFFPDQVLDEVRDVSDLYERTEKIKAEKR